MKDIILFCPEKMECTYCVRFGVGLYIKAKSSALTVLNITLVPQSNQQPALRILLVNITVRKDVI